MTRQWIGIVTLLALIAGSAVSAEQWYKGSAHMHTLWSDGDAAPEVAAAWYKDHGWNFICMSDHNIMLRGERYILVEEEKAPNAEHLAAIRARFGDGWVETKEEGSRTLMRLKTHDELAAHFDAPGEFLIVEAEEITTLGVSPHVNALNLAETIRPWGEGDMTDRIQHYLDAVAAQEKEHGRPMPSILNHVNFADAVTIEESMKVRGLRLFEVFNGHQSVNNWGHEGKGYPPTDMHWDVLLAFGIQQDPDYILYGLATDDAHNYFEFSARRANPGRGWIMVRAAQLETDALMEAIKQGNFYASTGVSLDNIRSDGKSLSFDILAEPGVTYSTQFIGTLPDFDQNAEVILASEGQPLERASKRYSETIGRVLHETTDLSPAYTFNGDELYVRAKVVSSKPHPNPHKPEDGEMAWVQPVRPKR